MNLPGFSAPASIYKANGHYRMRGTTSKDGGCLVRPAALFRIPWCVGLNWGCYSICAERCTSQACEQNCENQCTYYFPCAGSADPAWQHLVMSP